MPPREPKLRKSVQKEHERFSCISSSDVVHLQVLANHKHVKAFSSTLGVHKCFWTYFFLNGILSPEWSSSEKSVRVDLVILDFGIRTDQGSPSS